MREQMGRCGDAVVRVLSRFSGVPHEADKTLNFDRCEVAAAREFSNGYDRLRDTMERVLSIVSRRITLAVTKLVALVIRARRALRSGRR